MTVKTIKTYKNNPIYVSIHKNRYNYIDNYYSSDVSTNYDINLQLFEGLNSNIINNVEYYNGFYRSTSINFDEKDLWNKIRYIGNYNKVLMKKSDQKYYIENFLFNNFLVNGDGPTIEGTIAKNFTNNNKIYTNFYPQSTNWAITFWINTPKDSFIDSFIYGNYSTNRATPQLFINSSGQLLLFLASKTSSWNIASDVVVGTLELNKTYELTLTFDGSKYQFIIGTNSGENNIFNRLVTWEISSTTNVYTENNNQFCIGNDESNKPWNGEIDLYKSNIKVNDDIYWQAYSIIGIVQEGCLDNIEDTENEKTYSVFVKNDGDFILSESDEDKDGYLWANHVTIPAHNKSNPYKANFNMIGDVKINKFIAYNFSATNYINTNKINLTLNTNSVIKIISKIKTNVVNVIQKLACDNNSNNHGYGLYSNGKWRIWNGSANYSTIVAKANTYYWTQLVEDIANNTTKLYIMEDTNNYNSIDNLPSIDNEEWQLAISISTNLFNTSDFSLRFGNGYNTTAEYWRGTININNTQILVDSSIYNLIEII